MAKLSATSVAILIGLMQIAVIFACNCEVKHPQTQFKEANFVVRAKILAKHNDREAGDSSSGLISYLEYEVKIDKIFKGRKYIQSNVVNMLTPDVGSCGITSLKPGKKYLISGSYDADDSAFYLNVCSWVEEWSALTKEQKKGLKSTYRTKCRKCDVPAVSGPELVMMFIDPRAPSNILEQPSQLYSLSGMWASEPGSCTFNPVDSWQFPTLDCETQFTYCMENQREGCGWLINEKYKDCFIDRETAWAKRELRKASQGGSLRGRTMRIGGQRLGCFLDTPEDEFNKCLRREVAKIVTQYLRQD